MTNKIKKYVELLIVCGSLFSGLWFGLIQPAFRHLIKNEISLQYFILFEIATPEQIDNATRKWKAGKE